MAEMVHFCGLPGAGTTIGTKAAAAADPDGYTILIGATSFIIAATLYPHLDYDPIKAFAPVAMLAVSPQMLVIASSVPAKTVPEFVAHAKANPGKLNFGYGLGTLPQILGEAFKTATGTDIASIPYRGGAQAMTDMLGGRIQMIFGTQSTLLPLIREGKIRALAVTTETRARDLPDVPTMAESGLPQLTLGFSAGILAPAGTPAEIVGKLNGEINAAMRSPELAASLEAGCVTRPKTMRFENEAKQLGRWYDVYAFRVEDPNRRRAGCGPALSPNTFPMSCLIKTFRADPSPVVPSPERKWTAG
jgi:tripartite-type tricarboxylate transporter receptor subunit TctC